MTDDPNKEFLSQFEQFAHCTSHALADPVRKIIAICEQSAGGEADIKIIEKEANDLLSVIKDLRKYSFFVLKAPKFMKIQIKNIIADALDVLEDKGVHARQAVSCNFDNAPELVGDATQLVDVFAELIENAIKFSNQEPKISINYQGDGAFHIFSVSGYGMDISEPYIKGIFGLSMRGDNADDIKGHGMGLACVQAVANSHRGKAWAEFTEDSGNSFFISIDKSLSAMA